MANKYGITKNIKKPLSQDYEQLRQFGLRYIEQFSKDVWTDYNVHDPGITIMEVLSYVITDLAYRTSLPLEDILARLPGDATKDFFTAREILPCNPVTLDDLRKKIIDIEGVDNAWVVPYTNDPWIIPNAADPCSVSITKPAYYIQCNTTLKQIKLRTDASAGYTPRNLAGLYQFNLLLEEDSVLGDLNILSTDWEMRDSTGFRKALVRFVFPLDLGKSYPGQKDVTTSIEKLATAGSVTNYTVSNYKPAVNTFDLVLKIGAMTVNVPNVAFHIQPVHTGDKLSDLKNQMWNDISTANAVLKKEMSAKIFSVLAAKVAKASSIMDDVYCSYHKVRGLCEDVIKINVVPSQEIALCADIETDNSVDLETILGRIYFYVDTFFSPPVRFYLLKELAEKGLSTDIIFEGAVLKHGFIVDEELRRSSLFTEVHVSDLYNLIMGIEGVISIKYLQITNYFNGLPKTDGEFWKLDLNKDMPVPASYHLNLDRLRSKITFYKGDMPIIANRQVANRIYNDMKATLSKPKINPALKILNDILPPVGTSYQLEEYYSLQNDLPFAYGVTRDGIPSDADGLRRTKIKQLKGYLLFFDQLLANYLSQLGQVKNLFAVGNKVDATYFSQPVYDTPVPVLEDEGHYSNPPAGAQMPDPETQNFYGTAPLLNDFAIPPGADIDEADSYADEWKAFSNDKKNGYRRKLDALTEPADSNLDRRGRFQDHLLARFSENFAEYAAMMYRSLTGSAEGGDLKTAQEISADKFSFLQHYHVLSYNRGKGQYYKCCPLGDCGVMPALPSVLSVDEALQYDTYNIPSPSNPTGLHKRATLMLGMNINDNTNLVLGKFTVKAAASKFVFEVKYDTGKSLTSVAEYDSIPDAFAAMERVGVFATNEDNSAIDAVYFEVKPTVGGFSIEVKADPSAVVSYAVSSVYPLQSDAKAGLEKLKELFSDEGVHLLEHILLRPLPVIETIDMTDLTGGFFPLAAELNPDCDCSTTDYYSFRISAVLPYWTERFRDMDFRGFAEDTMHRETPAHIVPKFCWVSMYDMHRFETAYTEWFAENKKYKPDMALLKEKLKTLIKVLNTLTNVYPEGHLHDCDNPSTDNPVILGQTILGTF
jgi:hypothetical protein